ncbi:polyprenyl synthetase family protein [Ligilactobacillus pobuzihii]|uniref:Farnesyl diphosphate synthase n=1 Tax=Ligilactobacillus pobuzihii TaxID=449659 RepID=A0A0R2LU54_9LACO|nr:farnesyl diphosphate synthase [Ligilactobacillus pobuzihii]KRK11514.1 geranyltranstransferase [Ligilactobacillus pobuzihii E100301 = KCTC 13174]KRO02829.1 geranyltranstransferase [Ligilactobacillus pobuzihii]GEN47218.1 farnesyl-diphosphate synthase [Ligilactobacillus pobuzihii]
MSNKSISALQAGEISELNRQMQNRIKNLDNQNDLRDAMMYSVMAGGKRIRPLIVFATCLSLNKSISPSTYVVAGSLEFIHTYSLIHDDLPEMDNDDLRRGKPTNHKIYGQAMAVLAGDALLTEAFRWLSEVQVSAQRGLMLVHKLSQAAGALGMVDGQARDIKGEDQQLNIEQLKILHAGKTGALIRYAFEAGGVLANATEKQQKLLSKLGLAYGLAFQIYDDILDVTSSEQEMGKAVHKDQSENKNTYPTLLGLEGAKESLSYTLDEAIGVLERMKDIGVETKLFEELLAYFRI